MEMEGFKELVGNKQAKGPLNATFVKAYKEADQWARESGRYDNERDISHAAMQRAYQMVVVPKLREQWEQSLGARAVEKSTGRAVATTTVASPAAKPRSMAEAFSRAGIH